MKHEQLRQVLMFSQLNISSTYISEDVTSTCERNRQKIERNMKLKNEWISIPFMVIP